MDKPIFEIFSLVEGSHRLEIICVDMKTPTGWQSGNDTDIQHLTYILYTYNTHNGLPLPPAPGRVISSVCVCVFVFVCVFCHHRGQTASGSGQQFVLLSARQLKIVSVEWKFTQTIRVNLALCVSIITCIRICVFSFCRGSSQEQRWSSVIWGKKNWINSINWNIFWAFHYFSKGLQMHVVVPNAIRPDCTLSGQYSSCFTVSPVSFYQTCIIRSGDIHIFGENLHFKHN